jgi:hypothetical protein
MPHADKLICTRVLLSSMNLLIAKLISVINLDLTALNEMFKY